MTATPTRPAPPVTAFEDVTLVDTSAGLAALVQGYREAGRLMGMTMPKPLPGDPGRQAVRVRLRGQELVPTAGQPAPTPATRPTGGTARKQRSGRWVWMVPLTLVGATVVVGGALALLILTAVLTHLAVILGIAAGAAILLLLGGAVASGACPGIHCPGCPDR